MKLNPMRRTIVNETPYGIWVWILPDGRALGDTDGNIMNMVGTQYDLKASQAITDAAKSYGFPEGHAQYWPGKRPVTDEEYEEQLSRQRMGLIPDPLDYGAVKDESKRLRADG